MLEARAPRRLRSALANLGLAAGATVLVLVLFEAVFRLVPALLPAGSYGAGRFDPELGMNVLASGPTLYGPADPLLVEPNPDGFRDVAHQGAKPPGVTRIGFFGDSYVQAAQVPLETTFFRQVGRALGDRVETFGFGISGWGALHSLRAFQVLGPRYGLDVAVYVFVENDPGDEDYEIASHSESAGSAMPYAELVDGGAAYRVRWVTEPGHEPWWHAAAKFLQRHSLVSHVIRDRLALLRTRGVRVQADRADVEMSKASGALPDANDLPATWPSAYRERAERLFDLVLADWKKEAAAQRVRLLVLYVPRGESQLRGAIPRDDTWLPALESATRQLGIPLLDPSAALAARMAAGDPVYRDHWTPAGHEVIAAELSAYLERMLAGGSS